MIFFEATATDVLVVRILHGARDLPAHFAADGGRSEGHDTHES